MATPLYKQMKQRGSTFYAFPSSSMYKDPKFSKFVLLNIPNKIEDVRLDFEKENFNGTPFKIYTDVTNPTSELYSDQLIESLRNYVANHDTTMRDSKMNTQQGFYNIDEKQTPSEIIFWKWLRKMGAISFEVAEHKIDWDKNHPNYSNPNADTVTNTDYFRKYLWKEREPKDYAIEYIEYQGTVSGLVGNIVRINISYPARFKKGDKVKFTGNVGNELTINIEYEILKIDENEDNTRDIYISDDNVTTDVVEPSGYVTLSYNRVVQYIGEINAVSYVRTSTKDENEIVAYIPHQAGKSPSVLFTTRVDSNYFPGLELPILPEQIQTEIRGAEKLESPIRKNPGDYPGLYFGQFDTLGKTYLASDGDKIRYSGEYFGILRNNNVGLSDENYVELLSEFDATNLDGINIDFDIDHYLKMALTDEQVGHNFDEFNQMIVDGVEPQDFEYNAVLWYFEVDGNDEYDTNTYTNLYGITFLNNPDNDDDTDGTYITSYKKLVNNDEHDGLSYKHVLNISTSVDNDTSTLSFDPLTIHNTFGFDLYQNVLSNVSKLNESFINIINEFIRVNDELNSVKSIIYSQTDLEVIKSKILNLEELLKLYERYQFVDTESVKVITNYTGIYPTLALQINHVEYTNLYNLTIQDIYDYKVSTNKNYIINVPESNKTLVRITNNDTTNFGELAISLDKDLNYKQSIEIIIDANNAFYSNEFKILLQQIDSETSETVEVELLSNIFLPTDIGDNNPSNMIYNTSYYNDTNISQAIYQIAVSGVSINDLDKTAIYTIGKNIFGKLNYNEKVLIDNFKVVDDNNNVKDFTGVYTINNTSQYHNIEYFVIDLDSLGYSLISNPIVRIIKGYKIKITKIQNSNSDTIKNRYLIEKIYL